MTARTRGFRTFAAALAGVLLAAGLVGVAEVGPAGAVVVNDQPLSAVGSPMWQTNNTVWALDAGNNVVYAGGEFTSVRPPGAALGTGEVARSRIAAFNATTGALITSFNPNANGMVYDVDVSNDGTKLYVAGSFTTIGGVARQRIARLNLPSGTVDTGWSADANAIVATVTSDNNGVYVGGDFTTIKNTTRTRIAKLNTTNGDVVTAFNASSDKRIAESAIAPNGTRLLVGGENDVVNGLPQAGIASLDPTTGATMPWAATGVSPRLANGGCDANLTDIIISGTIAYVTAEAPSPGCWEGVYAANISDGSLVWNERCLGGSTSLAVANGWLYRGSHNHDCSKNVGGFVGPNNSSAFVWYRLESFRLSDGRLGHWTPKMNGGSPGTLTTVGPQVMATDGTQLFVGGDQSQLNGTNQEGLARFSLTGGNSAPDVPTTPRVTATAAGTLSISAEGVSDNNDGNLTYALYRDGGASPIATTTAESWPWSKPVLHFTDSGLTAGTSHSYQLTASDGTATSIRGPANVPVTVGWQNPPAYPAAVTAAGSAVAHWQLDGNSSPLADSSGHNHTGTIVGGVSTHQAGVELGNSAITTNGTNAYVTSSTAITPTAAFTESVWFKTTTERGGAIMGFSDAKTGVGTLDNRAIWMDNDGKIAFGIRRDTTPVPPSTRAGATNGFVRSLGTYNDGSWHQATAVFNGTDNISLYLDGTIVGAAAITQPILPAAGYLRVGYMDLTGFYTIFGSNFDGYPAVMSYYWQGSIDEASMHNRALTAAQVSALYASGAAHSAPLPAEQPDPGPPPPPPSPSNFPNLVLADAPSMYWRLDELGQLPVADSSGHNLTGTYRNGLSYGAPGALGDGSTGVLSPGTSGVAYSNQQVTNPQTYSLEAWVKTNTANGGKILGLENTPTGWGTTYDRQLYMTNNGRIAYGILAGGAQQVITSTSLYNDNVFHHIVATQGPSGMALYVDGALVGTNPTVAPDPANGYWRLGGGNLTGWPNAPASSALVGTFDEVAVYPTALSAARVAVHSDPGTVTSSGPPPPPPPAPRPTTPGVRGGYVLDGFGGLHRFTSHYQRKSAPLPPAPKHGPYWPGWDIARGVSYQPSTQQGLVVDGFGGLHPFTTGTARAAAPHGGPYWPGWDIARGVALMPNGKSGLVLDGFGGIHGFTVGSGSNRPPAVTTPHPYWPGWDIARGIVINRSGTGGYIVDGLGGIHPFGLNHHPLPPAGSRMASFGGRDLARGVSLLERSGPHCSRPCAAEVGGFTLDAFGGIHGFDLGSRSAIPTATRSAYWPNWDIARGITSY